MTMRQLYCESCATFNAATLDNSAATFRSDASTKTMRAGTMAFVWLMCSLWHIPINIAYVDIFRKAGLDSSCDIFCNTGTFPHLSSTFPHNNRGSIATVEKWLILNLHFLHHPTTCGKLGFFI